MFLPKCTLKNHDFRLTQIQPTDAYKRFFFYGAFFVLLTQVAAPLNGFASPLSEPQKTNPAPQTTNSHSSNASVNQDAPQAKALQQGTPQDLSHLSKADIRNRESQAYLYILNLLSERRNALAQEKIATLLEKTDNDLLRSLLFYWQGELALLENDPKKAAQNYGAAYKIAAPLLKNTSLLVAATQENLIFESEEIRLQEILLKLSQALKAMGKAQDAKLALREFNPKAAKLTPAQIWLYNDLKKKIG